MSVPESLSVLQSKVVLKRVTIQFLFKTCFIHIVSAKRLDFQVRRISIWSEKLCQINPESHNEYSKQFKSSLTNVLKVEENLLRVFPKLFCYGFVFQVIIDRTLCDKDFTSYLRDILYENCNFNSYKYSSKLAFISFLSFCMN